VLARELRCARRFVDMVESGACLPSPRALELWARALGIDPGEIAALHDIRDAVAG
jgi:transcriptional regulator with XRE-family HTH domain